VNIFLMVLQAIPAFLQLITTVEMMYSGAKRGEVKKETVQQGVNLALDTAYNLGAPITLAEKEQIAAGLGKAVDGTVELFNTFGWPGEAAASQR